MALAARRAGGRFILLGLNRARSAIDGRGGRRTRKRGHHHVFAQLFAAQGQQEAQTENEEHNQRENAVAHRARDLGNQAEGERADDDAELLHHVEKAEVGGRVGRVFGISWNRCCATGFARPPW